MVLERKGSKDVWGYKDPLDQVVVEAPELKDSKESKDHEVSKDPKDPKDHSRAS